MAISNEFILEWIGKVSSINGLQMDPNALTDDVVLMAYVFDSEEAFLQSMNSVVRALTQLINGVVHTSQLVHNYSGWHSHHFQSQRTQGNPSDLRIVFQHATNNIIKVKGFVFRYLPQSVKSPMI